MSITSNIANVASALSSGLRVNNLNADFLDGQSGDYYTGYTDTANTYLNLIKFDKSGGTVSGNVSVSGNTTIGGSNTNTLTINSTAVSIPNNLNIDSGTLFIDAANNNVGIGTSSTSAKLTVNGSAYITAGNHIYCDNFRVVDQYAYTLFYRAYNNVNTIFRFYGGTGSALHYNTSNLSLYPSTDAGLTLGLSTNRWGQIYSSVGSISTSDENEKEQIENLNTAERNVAVVLKSLIKKYKWKSAVKLKGDAARIHVGIIAQEVKSAFISEGLNPDEYGLFCYDEKWVKYEEVEDVKTGNVFVETKDSNEREEGSILQKRYGIRYDELLAFIISSL